eukprot:m.176483 g.176483  ORF g.176483 m.176483 type:complete len:1219 (+) comp14182_c0_seq1:368-4024(+)
MRQRRQDNMVRERVSTEGCLPRCCVPRCAAQWTASLVVLTSLLGWASSQPTASHQNFGPGPEHSPSHDPLSPTPSPPPTHHSFFPTHRPDSPTHSFFHPSAPSSHSSHSWPPPPPPPDCDNPNPWVPLSRTCNTVEPGEWASVLNGSFTCPDTRFLYQNDSGTNTSDCRDGFSPGAAPTVMGLNDTGMPPTTVDELLESLQDDPLTESTCRNQTQGQCTSDCIVRCNLGYVGSDTRLTCQPNGTLTGTVRLCLRLASHNDLRAVRLCRCDGPYPTASMFSCERQGVQRGDQCQMVYHDGTCPSLGCFRYCRRDQRVDEIRFWEFTAPSSGLISAMSLPATTGPFRYLRIKCGRVGRVFLTSPEACTRELDPAQDWRLEDGRSAFQGSYMLSLSVYDASYGRNSNYTPINLTQGYQTNPALEVAPAPPAYFVMNSSVANSWPLTTMYPNRNQIHQMCTDAPRRNLTTEETCQLAPYLVVCVEATGTPPYTVQNSHSLSSSSTAQMWPDGLGISTTTGVISVTDDASLVPGVHNASLVIFDGNQQTANVLLQIIILEPLSVVTNATQPWEITGGLRMGQQAKFALQNVTQAGEVHVLRGDFEVPRSDIGRIYSFVACGNESSRTLNTDMSQNGVLTYSGYGTANLSVYVFDTRSHGPEDYAYVGEINIDIDAPTPSPTMPSRNAAQSRDVSTSVLVVSVVVPVVISILVLVLWMADRRYRQRHKVVETFVFPPPDAWEYDRSRLSFGPELGSGMFGVVHRAQATGIRGMHGKVTVAVKECSEDRASLDDMMNFVREADLMKRLDHPNVLRLLGVCMQEHPLLIIAELMKKGDLKRYLRQHPSLSVPSLMTMCEDVAEGLSYLAIQHRFVHRDLASRNCLVDHRDRVKIGDFGMTRANTYKDYYKMQATNALLPVRWMAPEALSTALFTAASDVWSLGIVVWEVMSYGEVPYPAMGNEEVFAKVRQGYRLSKPPVCPEPLYSMMRRCWEQDPSVRPTAEAVAAAIRETKSHWRPPVDTIETLEPQSETSFSSSDDNDDVESSFLLPYSRHRVSEPSINSDCGNGHLIAINPTSSANGHAPTSSSRAPSGKTKASFYGFGLPRSPHTPRSNGTARTHNAAFEAQRAQRSNSNNEQHTSEDGRAPLMRDGECDETSTDDGVELLHQCSSPAQSMRSVASLPRSRHDETGVVSVSNVPPAGADGYSVVTYGADDSHILQHSSEL